MAMKWYVVHTYSNFENQAKKSLESGSVSRGCRSCSAKS
jgi:transcription antitermination factor NusG